ncbi:MAG: alpha/beta fold hydrolase [bacterium]|nr:alpha/beta fold hydrolase [bacterium]
MNEERLNGIRIGYEVLGDECAGDPVVFLNGVMMTTRSWVLQTAVMRKTFRCVLHDFRGQLLSGKPDRPWTLEDHAGDLLALLDHLEIERCHLVGTSYGGEVGMIFAFSHPDRVMSLSLISSVSEVGEELDRVVAEWGRAALEAPDDLYRISVPSNFSPQFVADHPEVIEQGEARLRACPPDFFTGLAGLIKTFRWLDVTAELHRIRCPTLVMVGEEDLLKPPPYSRLIVERISDSELRIVPEAGHALIIEKPDEVNAAISEFLAKHG